MSNAKAHIFIDQSNYHYYLSRHSWIIDWKRFAEHFQGQFDQVRIYFYDGILSKKAYLDRYPSKNINDFNDYKKAKKRFFSSLRELGFAVRSKPVGAVYDYTSGTLKKKCNFDVEITIDAIDNLDRYDVLILCSGDGDFVRLLKYVKGKYKKTILIPPDDRANWDLVKTANQVIYLGDLKETVRKT